VHAGRRQAAGHSWGGGVGEGNPSPLMPFITLIPLIIAHGALKLHMAELLTHPLGVAAEFLIEARTHFSPLNHPPRRRSRQHSSAVWKDFRSSGAFFQNPSPPEKSCPISALLFGWGGTDLIPPRCGCVSGRQPVPFHDGHCWSLWLAGQAAWACWLCGRIKLQNLTS